MAGSRPDQYEQWDESGNQIAAPETRAAFSKAGAAKGGRENSSCSHSHLAIKGEILFRHFFCVEACGILQTELTILFARSRIAQPQQIVRESIFIRDIAQQSCATGDFRHRRRITTKHRTATGLRFRDRPAKPFKTRGKEKGVRAVVKRFQ